MSATSRNKKKTTPKKTHGLSKPLAPLETNVSSADKYFPLFTICALLAFGIYHSVIYFGHQAVPNPDFPGFFGVGRRLWQFRLPGQYMRAPVTGLLQYAVSIIVPNCSALTAGWLVNAIIHPFNIVLLYLVGKQIVGRAAAFIAIIAILNPWAIHNLIEPIAETPLLLFTLLAFYFMFRRSNWCYLFAAFASMVRYEGTALIAAAFVLDMITRTGKRQRLIALGWAALASTPFLLWMLGTFLTWDPNRVHYLGIMAEENPREQQVTGVKALVPHLNLLWKVTFAPIFQVLPGAGDGLKRAVEIISKTAAVGTFLIGLCYGLCKRNWKILALIIFLLPYYLVHVNFPFLLARFYSSVHWIVMLICLLGLQGIWAGINKLVRVPKAVTISLHVLIIIAALLWLRPLLPHLDRLAKWSVDSRSIPWVGLALLLVLLAVGIGMFRARRLSACLAVTALLFLMIVSNQFTLAQVIGNGKTDYEFKLLADWYHANASPGEKVVSTMTDVMQTILPEHASAFTHITHIKGDDAHSFIQQCRENGITYIAWDSRKGLYPNDRYSIAYRLHRIAPLRQPQSIGPFEYIITVGNPRSGRFINIFRLRPAPK